MPVLRHATLAKLVPSIRKHGLLTAKAVGAKRVWLHSPTKSFWGALHTVKRHGGRAEDAVILFVNVPRKSLRRFASKGLWYSPTDIPPDAIKPGALSFSDIASSPPVNELPQ